MAEASTGSTSDKDNALHSWTRAEKYRLLQGLQAFERHDIENIQEVVATKTFEETKAAIDYYTNKALQHPVFLEKQDETKAKSEKKPQEPLASWANLLTENFSFEELCTDTATAVRMLADLGDIPPPASTENIDFRQVYHQIANALEGKPLTTDVATAAVLQKCLQETALSSKAFLKSAEFKNIVKNIDVSDKDMNMLPRPTDNHELAILRHLASQRNYNPLKIPEDYLKPSSEPANDDKKCKK